MAQASADAAPAALPSHCAIALGYSKCSCVSTRAALAETVYTVLRKKLLFEHMAPSGSGPKERRLAILGFAHWQDEEARRKNPKALHGERDFLKAGLNDRELQWLEMCDDVV